MELATRPPHPALAGHVRSLAGWHERADAPVRRAELPGGRIVLVISFGPTLDIDGRRFGSFAAGLHDAPAITEHAGEGHGIQAYLTPLGGRQLLGMPMSELTGQVVELSDLIGPSSAAELAERLLAASDWGARFALLERAIAARVLDAPPLPTGLEWAWERLLKSDGAAPVGALADELGWSRRRLAASFREQLGLPPKPLARLLRFERAVARLRAGADLADVALDSGYYDQAHFNRDFRRFAGATPTEYRRATSGSAVAALRSHPSKT
jgi:AraC-like DNA-binding protein